MSQPLIVPRECLAGLEMAQRLHSEWIKNEEAFGLFSVYLGAAIEQAKAKPQLSKPVGYCTVYRQAGSPDKIELGPQDLRRDQVAKTWGWSVELAPLFLHPQAPASKCDGNHGGPRCADPGCWNDDDSSLALAVSLEKLP